MAGEPQFTIGARASCTDGHCGEVRRLIIDPATETVTHLVIQPGHDKETARLVPVHMVETTDGGVRLRCTRTEFDQLDHAEERELGGVLGPGFGYNIGGDTFARVGGAGSVELINLGPVPGRRQTVVEDVVPVGEDQVGPGDRVHAVDGHVRDTGSRESTTGLRSRGVAWSSPAGPGGGVEKWSEAGPRAWPRGSDCHPWPGHGCPG